MKTVYLLVAVAVGATSVAFAEKQPFARYQTIIDRMPFGQPPPGFDPTKSPDEVSKDDYRQAEAELTQEQEAIQKAVHFSVINVDPGGTVRVGFSDRSDPAAPRHYYMAVGEERGGWIVKDADPVEKTMTIEKDDVEVALTLGENSGGDAKSGKAATGRAPARAAVRPVGGGAARSPLLSRGGASAPAAAPEATSYRSRRERREAEEAARRKEAAEREAERKAQEEERKVREEEEKAAREAERAEQREQLNAIKEELRKAREEQAAARESAKDGDDDGDDDAED